MIVSVTGFLSVFLLLQPWSIAGDFLAPLHSPIFDACNEVKCGHGICKPSNNNTIPFECECKPGWKQLVSTDEKFLPCVIPNCSLGMDCKDLNIGFMNRSPPAPPPNLSDDHSNQANFQLEGSLEWVILSLFLWAI